MRRWRTILLISALVGAVPAVGTAGPAEATSSSVPAVHGSITGGFRGPIVAIFPTPTGNGYWIATGSGQVFAFGDARYLGGADRFRLNAPILAAASTPTGRGYWLFAADGGVFSFGDARFWGSTGGMRLNAPIVTAASTPTGRGYWLFAADGGVFSFGDARFYGSLGGIRLNQPIVTAGATRRGYRLFARDGGVFNFGDARFYGAWAVPYHDSTRFVSGASRPQGDGYWLVTDDGRVRGFGRAFTNETVRRAGIVAAAVHPAGNGLWLVDGFGQVHVVIDHIWGPPKLPRLTVSPDPNKVLVCHRWFGRPALGIIVVLNNSYSTGSTYHIPTPFYSGPAPSGTGPVLHYWGTEVLRDGDIYYMAAVVDYPGPEIGVNKFRVNLMPLSTGVIEVHDLDLPRTYRTPVCT